MIEQGRGLASGTMVSGDWRIERVLGQGGFGVTYEARNLMTHAHVALKEYMPSGLCTRIEGSTKITPAPGPAADVFKRGLAGFMKEAETLARLDHPSIVRMSGFFETNGTAYMALAYETDGTVAGWLKHLGRSPSQDELDRLLWPLIDALIQVHSLPLLHRDIKPDNIMLRADGTPVLIDFGAVKNLVSSESRSIHGPATLNFVTDGYAPPEQYVSEGDSLLGPWTDVYALGATICEAVTGARPPSATRRMVEESHRPLAPMLSDPTASGLRSSFLEGVDRAMSLRRSDRPQSMVEFRRAIGLVEAPRAITPHQRPTVQVPAQTATDTAAAPLARPVTFGQLPGHIQSPAISRSKAGLWTTAVLAAVLSAGAYWAGHRTGSTSSDAGRSAAPGAVKSEVDARRLAEEKAAADVAARARAEAESNRIATEKAKADEAGRQRVAADQRETAAAEAKRKVEDGTRRPDPVVALAPGSGQSARDRLVDGSACAFCPEMVVAPSGSFTMGSPESEPQRAGSETQLTVTIARPFAAAKFAVTFEEWDACVDDGGCKQKPTTNWGRGRQPVHSVSWDDVTKEYLPWLSRKTGKTYRLLSEAEREYVTRAGTTTPFWWGPSITPEQANYDGSVTPYQGGGSRGEYRKRTVPVDSFAPNPWGLYQVHGNVWEWTADCWNASTAGNPGDGSSRISGECGRRVVRAGSWYIDPQSLRAALRLRYSTVFRVINLGFRLARTLNP